MKVIASTYSSIVLVDLHTGQFEVLEENRKWYYGITWNPCGDLYLNHSFLTDQDLIRGNSQDQQKGKVSLGKLESQPCLACPHQLIWHNDSIYVTNTGLNCIEKFSEDLSHRETIRFEKEPWDLVNKQKVGFHYNSVFIRDELIYLVAHNWESPSFVKIFKIDNFKEVDRIDIPGTNWAHNVFEDSTGMYVCNTKQGSLVEARTGATVWQCDTPGLALTRGLAATDDVFVIGKTPFNSDRASRGKKRSTKDNSAGLWVIDRNTMKTVKYVNLPGHSSLGEVRILGETDHAHNGIILLEGEIKNETNS